MTGITTTDVLIVGGGIAGATVGEKLTRDGYRAAILEMEDRPGYHTTGRSAAALIESYGPPAVRELTGASLAFFENPPDGFTETPLLSQRGMMTAARAEEVAALEKFCADFPGVQRLTESEALSIHGGLAPGVFEGGFAYEPSVRDVDVAAFHQAALRAFKRQGGAIHVNAELTAGRREGGAWHVETMAGRFEAPVLIDCAGAWGDVVAERCGVAPVGLQPKRRTVAVVEVKGGNGPVDPTWPMADGPGACWFFKPDGNRLWCSPADETPVDPHDAWPDDMDVAEGVDAMERATGYEVTKLVHAWAGLRTFTPDGDLHIAQAANAEGFIWLVGQGGYGFQTAPAAAERAAALATRCRL